jgi:hypothetical protein
VLRATVGTLEVATDTFELDVIALPFVNELGADGTWRVERNGELVDAPHSSAYQAERSGDIAVSFEGDE